MPGRLARPVGRLRRPRRQGHLRLRDGRERQALEAAPLRGPRGLGHLHAVLGSREQINKRLRRRVRPSVGPPEGHAAPGVPPGRRGDLHGAGAFQSPLRPHLVRGQDWKAVISEH